MNEFFLEDILEEAYKLDFAEHENPPEHRFSLKHKIRMRKIFSLYKKNTKRYNASLYKRSVKMSLRMAIIVIILAALTVTAAAVTITFLRREHEDNTQLFAANIEGAPTVLEDIYVLTALPIEYECTTDNLMLEMHTSIFTHKITGKTVMFTQTVKSEFYAHYNTEGYEFQEISVNDHDGLYIDFAYDGIESGLIVWDNGDYIFDIDGDLSKDELIHLAETIKIQ